MQTSEHIVAEADDAIRLDRWFKRHMPGLTHALLEKQLRKGMIRLDGKKAKASDRVQAGQVIRLQAPGSGIQGNEFVSSPKPEARILKPSDAQFVRHLVLYKDANLIVINKPFGLPVQGGNKIARSLDDLLDGLREQAGERPKLVHRLDRDTTGCLVLARTAKAATALMPLFATRRVEKTYLALVNGLPDPLQGRIDLPLLKKDNPRASAKGEGRPPSLHSGVPGNSLATPKRSGGGEYEIMQVDKAGQKAVTEYRVLEMLARKFALVELKPLTGRTHQLRVHMQAIGCPIVGDHKYGGATEAAVSLGVENILHLHARKISLPPLLGGKAVNVTAPLPAHMKKSFDALGLGMPK